MKINIPVSSNLFPISRSNDRSQSNALSTDKAEQNKSNQKASPNEFNDGFAPVSGGIRTDLGRATGRAMSGSAVLDRSSARTAEIDGSPSFRIEKPREFAVYYENAVTVGVDGTYEGATLRYFDNTNDEDYSGRYFINNNTFLDDAIQLYENSSEYLDHENAWLQKDITRYAKDVARFFGTDPDDVTELRNQLENYVRQAAGSDEAKAKADNTTLTIGGVDFSVKQFLTVVGSLKSDLGKGIADEKAKLTSAISNISDSELNQSQKELVLNTQNKWERYSEWASFYGHDEGAFKMPESVQNQAASAGNIATSKQLVFKDDESFHDFMTSIKNQGEKNIPTSEELLASSNLKGDEMRVMTPTNRMKVAYEFSITYPPTKLLDYKDGKFVESGEVADSAVTMKYADRAKDKDIPGRFFINGTSFFDEASQLYASDSAYLDHERAWLPEDIKRYAQDAARFFGGNPDDTLQFEKQIEQYIRSLADSETAKSDLDMTRFTVAGVDFDAKDFIKTVEYLNKTFVDAGKNGMSDEDVSARIRDFAEDNLNDQQTKMLLSSENKWASYSKWAAFYGRDFGVFQYS